MLLSAAKVLSEHREELNCTVKFIFQPAEEAMNGAMSILDSGLVDDLNTVAGMHIFPKLPAGTVSVDPGPRYTSAAFMNIKIIGKSGHGAMPENAVDPIYVACKVVDALQSIASREANPNDTVVVSICTFHCGTRPNIIAECAELSGTVRTFNPELRKSLPERIERIIKGTCEAHRATYEFDYYVDLPATITDERCSRISERAVKKAIGEEHLINFPGTPGGEDFSYFLERTPGVYAFIGCRTPENDCLHELHSNKFNLDEDSMLNGAAFYVQYTLEAQDEQW
jgi:amidohydrolase